MRRSTIVPLLTLALLGGAGCAPTAAPSTAPEILLIGVLHRIPDSLACNWKSAYDKVLRYAPDAIAVEHAPPADSLSMAHYLGEDYKAYRDSVMQVWEGRVLSLEEVKAMRIASPSGADSTARWVQLWRYAALALDLGNRDQASYQLRYTDVHALVDTSSAFGRAFVKKHARLLDGMRETEFGNLVHPLAAALGIEHLHPTDERRYNAAQSLAYQAFADKLDSAQKRTMEGAWAASNAAEAEATQRCEVLELVNTHAWIAHADSMQTKVLGSWGDVDHASFVQAWESRNRSIADRIIAAAEQDQAQRIAVFYGYMHVAPVKRALEAKGYRVKVLEDLE